MHLNSSAGNGSGMPHVGCVRSCIPNMQLYTKLAK